mgnify:CR=1 FL=1
MSLKTKIGNINLESCLFNASGVYCKTKDHLSSLNECNSVGAILTKSCTLDPREGNALPIYWDDGENVSINSSGLPNLGFEYYIYNKKKKTNLYYYWGKLCIIILSLLEKQFLLQSVFELLSVGLLKLQNFQVI